MIHLQEGVETFEPPLNGESFSQLRRIFLNDGRIFIKSHVYMKLNLSSLTTQPILFGSCFRLSVSFSRECRIKIKREKPNLVYPYFVQYPRDRSCEKIKIFSFSKVKISENK